VALGIFTPRRAGGPGGPMVPVAAATWSGVLALSIAGGSCMSGAARRALMRIGKALP
jgi:hypothetical protein